MQDASCRRADIVAAYDELTQRYDDRRSQLWTAYLAATSEMTRSEYEECEHECWSVLTAGLSGIDAEQRVMARAFEERMAQLDDDVEMAV